MKIDMHHRRAFHLALTPPIDQEMVVLCHSEVIGCRQRLSSIGAPGVEISQLSLIKKSVLRHAQRLILIGQFDEIQKRPQLLLYYPAKPIILRDIIGDR